MTVRSSPSSLSYIVHVVVVRWVVLAAVSLLVFGAGSSARAQEPPASTTRGAPPRVAAPMAGHPTDLFGVPGGDVVAQMPDGSFLNVPGGERIFRVPQRDERGQTQTVMCDVKEGPRVLCLRQVYSARDKSKGLELYDSEAEPRQLAGGSGPDYTVTPLGVFIDPDGAANYLFQETFKRGDETVTKQTMGVAGVEQEVALALGDFISGMANIGAGERVGKPIQMRWFRDGIWLIYRSGKRLVTHPVDESPNVVAELSLYDIRPVVGPDGWFYVFYHEPGSATARVAASRNGETWKDIIVDGKESGWQMEAFADERRVYGLFYYFLNTYNKGLRVVSLEGGKLVEGAATIFREDRFNAGWHPQVAVAGDGTTWLTYLDNVEEDTRAWSRFDHARDLRDTTINGGTTWEESYKDYYLQTGAGGWLTFWHLADGAPSASDIGGVDLGGTKYNVGTSVLVSANIEARYAWLDLGLSYAQSVVDDAAEEVEDSTGVATGDIKISELLPGHDVKVAVLWGRYRGRAVAGDNVEGPAALAIKTNYVDTQLLALNKWRVKYGLAFTNYTIPASVHAFSASAGSSSYAYATSELKDVTFTDIDFVVGYSKLDYAAKYENSYNGIIADGTLGVGLAIAGYDAIATPDGDTDGTLALHLRGTVMLGWLSMVRFRGLRGFGIYIRPAYVADVGYTGPASAPGDRDETENDSALSTVSIFSLRHGPWLDAGLVW